MDLFANSRREASSSRYARVFYLAVGIVSFVAGIGLLGLNALNGAWWPWVANAESAKWEQLVDNGVPIEVVELAKDCKAWANCAVFPIAIGEEWSGEVVVAEFGTYNDLWRGSEATFAVTYDSSWQPRSVKTHGADGAARS